jgi:hypothetical protein
MLATQGRWTFSTRYHELQRSASYGVRIVPLSPFQLDVTDLDFTDACQPLIVNKLVGFLGSRSRFRILSGNPADFLKPSRRFAVTGRPIIAAWR